MSSSQIKFTIAFHGPFRVGTGIADRGLDDSIDQGEPLPASSVKGAMRAAAELVLGLPPAVVGSVFGGEGSGNGSPWAWSTPQFQTAPTIRPRARNQIGPDGVAVDQALALTEHAWADAATFLVEQQRSVRVLPKDEHIKVLAAAAISVTALGAWRTRGLGAVSIRPVDSAIDLNSVAATIHRLRNGSAVTGTDRGPS